jgi:phage/plasmid-like protein (TIGR03299 family)
MRATRYDINNATTAAEALDEAHLNWEAQPVGLITENGISVIDHRAIIRSDNNVVIGVVGDRYVPIQNTFAFSFFDTVCLSHQAKYNAAYVFDGGRKVILEASLGDPVEIRKGDEVVRRIQLINTFDGSHPLLAQFTVWRLICSNGLMAFSEMNKCRILHTKNGENKANDALLVIAKGVKYFEHFESLCRELAQRVIDQKVVDAFLKHCFGEEGGTRQKNLIAKVIECYEAGKGTGQGTAWDMYNGYVEWIDHFRSADDETRLANSILGATYLKEQAFSNILKLVK